MPRPPPTAGEVSEQVVGPAVAQRPSSGEQEWVKAPAGHQPVHLRSGDGCGGRLRPGWPQPGGRHGRRTSMDRSCCAVEGRGWEWRQCRPGTDPSCQTHDQLHLMLGSVLQFFPPGVRHAPAAWPPAGDDA